MRNETTSQPPGSSGSVRYPVADVPRSKRLRRLVLDEGWRPQLKLRVCCKLRGKGVHRRRLRVVPCSSVESFDESDQPRDPVDFRLAAVPRATNPAEAQQMVSLRSLQRVDVGEL